ncbi:hypothetical protein BDY19DRAFT_866127, partial [Irpex rosettiformis]
AKLVTALGAVFNFIRVHDPSDIDHYENITQRSTSSDPGYGDLSTHVSSAEKQRADIRREQIAQAMWTQYQTYTSSQ